MRVLLGAQTHKEVQTAGAIVKARVDVICADESIAPRSAATGTNGAANVPLDPSKLRAHLYPGMPLLPAPKPATAANAPASSEAPSPERSFSTPGFGNSSMHSQDGATGTAAIGVASLGPAAVSAPPPPSPTAPITLLSVRATLCAQLRVDESRVVLFDADEPDAARDWPRRRGPLPGDDPLPLGSIQVYDALPPVAIEALRSLTGELVESGVEDTADCERDPAAAADAPVTASLQQGMRRSFNIAVRLPWSAPPSYRSYAFRIDYRILVRCIWRRGSDQLRETTLKVPLTVVSPMASVRLLRQPYYDAEVFSGLDVLRMRAIALTPRPNPKIAPPLADELSTRSTEAARAPQNGSPATPFLRQARASNGATELTLRHAGSPDAVQACVCLFGTVVALDEPIVGAVLPEIRNVGEWTCVRVRVALECDELVPTRCMSPGTLVPDATRRVQPRVPRVLGEPEPELRSTEMHADLSDFEEEFVVMGRREYGHVDVDTTTAIEAPFELSTCNVADPTHAVTHTTYLQFVRQQWYLRITMHVARTVDVTAHGGDATSLKCAPADEFEMPVHVIVPERPALECMGAPCWTT